MFSTGYLEMPMSINPILFIRLHALPEIFLPPSLLKLLQTVQKISLPYANHLPPIVSTTLNCFPLKTITPFLLLLANSETNFILPPPQKKSSVFSVSQHSPSIHLTIPPRQNDSTLERSFLTIFSTLCTKNISKIFIGICLQEKHPFNIFAFYTSHAPPMASTLLPNLLDSLSPSIF